MTARVCLFAVGAAAALTVAGCTSNGPNPDASGANRSASSSGTSSSGRSSSSVTPTVTHTPATASTVATCSPSSTRLTYHEHAVVTSEEGVGLAGGHSRTRLTTPRHLSVATVVRAAAGGLGTGSGLTAAVERHWHARTVAALGKSTVQLDPDATVTVKSNSAKNTALVVYRSTHVYTGTFSSFCGGATVTGHYTTFGPISTTVADCHGGGKPSALERYARRGNC